MSAVHVRLKDALQSRHWQTYKAFCREFDRAARDVDESLVGTWPSRAQLHRWLVGELKGLPYADHCLVIERMLPGSTARELFSICTPPCPSAETGRDPGPEEKTVSARGAALPNDDSSGRATTPATGAATLHEQLAAKISGLEHQIPASPFDPAMLTSLIGNLVDLSVVIDLNIEADGLCDVTYQYYFMNLTGSAITRLTRDLWFQHSRGRLDLVADEASDRYIAIQRLHSAENIAKFALQLSPPIEPGDAVRIGYTCSGGDFRKDFYWRQAIARHTGRFTLNVRHHGLGPLAGFTAIEELPDGTERLHHQAVTWHYDGDDLVMTLRLVHLQPNQYATLRWETS